MTKVHDPMAPRLEVQSDGQVVVHADPHAAVCVVNKDGVITTVMSSPGKIVVRLEHQEAPEWTHTFTYSIPNGLVHEGHTSYSMPTLPPDEPQRRPRGRPRMSQAVKERLTMDDTIT